MKRKIIKIDEARCNGCGECIPNCHEGAIQLVDGKAKLVADVYCDGLGACLGHCPLNAITIEEREADPFDEQQVIAKQEEQLPCGCPGSAAREIKRGESSAGTVSGQSELRQWPVQLHLVNPRAPYFQKSDVVLAADCVAYALGDFHANYLKGKTLAIACPKLDSGQDVYLDKLKALIDEAQINSLTVMIMEVPCCGGLYHLAEQACSQGKRKIPLKKMIVGIEGQIMDEVAG